MHILVAEDNEANRLIARAILEREGHTVSLARDGAEALDLARIRRFDVVILDILILIQLSWSLAYPKCVLNSASTSSRLHDLEGPPLASATSISAQWQALRSKDALTD